MFTYKKLKEKLKEKLTVSDSKKLFHEQFPYVIPGLYKRIVDEMLVELNLLNHQNEFTQDYLFCVGLTETYKELMKGYKPEKHLDLLFESLCSSTNFEAKEIKEISKKFLLSSHLLIKLIHFARVRNTFLELGFTIKSR